MVVFSWRVGEEMLYFILRVLFWLRFERALERRRTLLRRTSFEGAARVCGWLDSGLAQNRG